MVAYIFALAGLLAAIAYFCSIYVALQDINVDEIRTQARRGGRNAKRLYALCARDQELFAALAIYICVLLSAYCVTVVYLFGWLEAAILISVTTFVFSYLIPQLFLRKHAVRWAALSSSLILWLMSLVRPLSGPLGRAIKHRHHKREQTITRDALIEMIRSRRVTTSSDAESAELGTINHVLQFSDHKIFDLMTPKKDIVFIRSDEMVLPAFLQKLHNSGFSRLPVVSPDDKNTIVGTVFLRDLAKVTEPVEVSAVMDRQVNYLNAKASLSHALNAAVRTGRSLFIVIDDSENTVGVITIEDILSKLLGKKFTDDFDLYDQRSSVATLDLKNIQK